MRTIIAAVMSTVVMMGSAAANPPTKKASLRNQLMPLIINRMKDPDSAKFTNLRVREAVAPGVMYQVCGTVNAKNSYGGYNGAWPFFASIVADRISWFVIGDSRSAGMIENDLCKDVKTPL